MRPAAKRFGEWASASRVFSAITHLSLTSLPSFSGKLIIYFFHFLVRACSTSSCLPAEVVVWCNYVLALKASPPDVEMAGLGALRFGGESALVPGCLCDGTGTLYRMFSVV